MKAPDCRQPDVGQLPLVMRSRKCHPTTPDIVDFSPRIVPQSGNGVMRAIYRVSGVDPFASQLKASLVDPELHRDVFLQKLQPQAPPPKDAPRQGGVLDRIRMGRRYGLRLP